MKPAIVVQRVSKKYSRNPNAHLAYGVTDLVREIFGLTRALELREDEFFAVDNASFHIDRGESFALIGRNGSGKTTLLKMINGIVKVDAGTIVVDGRVQALINLGAGFNPALSGRDNVFNSASLGGLGRKETMAVFDEIVGFAELEEFIDTPVGAYSAGMKARLGFAVAINLRPDILLIDEILAVGDQAFRNKCFVKMHQLKKQGVTIVLVSHSMTHVAQLCDRALWIHKGRVRKVGPAKDTIKAYLDFLDELETGRVRELNALKEETSAASAARAAKKSEQALYGPVYDETDQIEDIFFRMLINGEPADAVPVHGEVVIEYGFRLKRPVTDLNVTLAVYRKDGLPMTVISTLNGDLLKDIHEGRVHCRVAIPDFNLNPGAYVWVMPVHEGKSYLYRNVMKEFAVTGHGAMTWELIDLRYEYHVQTPEDRPETLASFGAGLELS